MKVKATVRVTVMLPPGAEMIENIQSEGENMGPTLKLAASCFVLTSTGWCSSPAPS